MKQYKILEQCEEMYKKADTLDEEQEQTLRDEVNAIGEAVHAIDENVHVELEANVLFYSTGC